MPHTPDKSSRMEVLADMSKDQLLQIIADAIGDKTPGLNNVQENAKDSKQIPYEKKEIPTSQNCTSISTTRQDLTPKEASLSEQLPFLIPTAQVKDKLQTIQNISNILGNCDDKLISWYSAFDGSIDNFISELNQQKDKVNIDFIKSLETITKIFSITSKFSPIESINESVLTPTIRNLISDYNHGKYESLEKYATENLSMFDLNKDVEENLVRLIPILSQQLTSFNKQLKKFYSLYSLIDDDNEIIELSFLQNLPTKSDISLFDEINRAIDIKTILQTNFSKINPTLVSTLENKIQLLNEYINTKCLDMKILIEKVLALNHQLFQKNDPNYLQKPSYLNDSTQLLLKVGIKSLNFQEYNDLLSEMAALKEEREKLLNQYLIKVEQLWSILRPESNDIQGFLKHNKNLYSSSLKNFETLLTELETEKVQNIKRFINSSRAKIQSFWDVLMYDESSRQEFGDFFVQDENAFDEYLLESHSQELERLRKETEDLKPLLNLVSQLDNLIQDKLRLEEASKDSSRLLKRNSFKILKQEEMTRKRLAKDFPLTIKNLRTKINQFEIDNKRAFKINGEPYLEKIDEIEEKFVSKKRNYRSNFNSPTLASTKRNNLSNKSQPIGTRVNRMTPKSIATPSRSIIRKRDLSDMTNPFLSNSNTPLKRITKSTALTPTTSKSTHTISSSPQQLSTEPIILRGTSPVKNLNLNACTKVDMLLSSKSPKNPERGTSASLKRNGIAANSNKAIRSPMISLSNRFNNIDNIQQKQNVDFPISSPKPYVSEFKYNDGIKERGHNHNSSSTHIPSAPVEELSDSMIDYSDSEDVRNELTTDKENEAPTFTKSFSSLPTIAKQPIKGISNSFSRPQPRVDLAHMKFNLSLDSETF